MILPLEASWHPGILPQFLALPLVVKRLFGVSSRAASTTSASNAGLGSDLALSGQIRHRALTGLPSGRERMGFVWPSVW